MHCSVGNDYDVELDPDTRPVELNPEIRVDETILRIFNERFRPSHEAGSLTRTALLRGFERGFRRILRLTPSWR